MTPPEHRTALITGASAGIGAEFAHQLAGLGYDLVLVARRRSRLAQLASEISRSHGVVVDILPADLSTEAGITLVEERIKELDNLEMLVNNAGFSIPASFLATGMAETMTMVSVHILAPVRFTRAALPGMIENGRGFIINVSSISAFTAAAGSSTYSGTKAFLNNFTEGLASECRGQGVRLQCLCPGFTRTEFHDSDAFKAMRFKERLPGSFWMTAHQVVRYSLACLKSDRVICIPGLGNQLIALAGRLGWIRFWVRLYLALTGRSRPFPD